MISANERNTQLSRKTHIGGKIFPSGFCYSESVVTNRKYIGLSDFSGELALVFTYDRNGNRTSMTDPTGTQTYLYDSLNRLTKITNQNGEETTFNYDAIGRRTGMTYANGVTASYSYDDASRLLSLVHQIGATNVSTFSYTHDNVGNRTSMDDNDGTHNYLYDQLYRLVEALHPQPVNPAEAFEYDPVGNRTTSHLSTAYTYDNMNRLVENDQYTYTYDANGNLTSKVYKSTTDTTTYQYDSENRLIQVTTPTSNISYQYDGMGKRIAKTVDGVITKYVYDEKDVLLEVDENDQIKARYTRTLDIDDLISVNRDTTGDGTLDTAYYYHEDGLGSVMAMTDSGGNKIQEYVYDSFGKIVKKTGSVENVFTYTSREWEEEAQLYYYRARYYDPEIGRFLTEDPSHYLQAKTNNIIFDSTSDLTSFGKDNSIPYLIPSLLTTPQELNSYTYVSNNPLNLIDPIGLCGCSKKKKSELKCLAKCGITCAIGCKLVFKTRIICVPLCGFICQTICATCAE